eukprot:COSAG04_NODE_657_length_11477_cov_17.225962_15_plen_66_part_00
MPRPARCRACGATTLPRCNRAQLPYVKPVLETFGSTIREDLNIDAFGRGAGDCASACGAAGGDPA